MIATACYWWEGELRLHPIKVQSYIPSQYPVTVYSTNLPPKFDPRNDWDSWISGMERVKTTITCHLIPDLGVFYGDASVLETWKGIVGVSRNSVKKFLDKDCMSGLFAPTVTNIFNRTKKNSAPDTYVARQIKKA